MFGDDKGAMGGVPLRDYIGDFEKYFLPTNPKNPKTLYVPIYPSTPLRSPKPQLRNARIASTLSPDLAQELRF